MSNEQYVVKGTVVVDNRQGMAAMNSFTQRLTGAQAGMSRIGPSITGVIGRVAGLAAGFLGVRSAVNQVSSAMDFHNQLEQNTAGMAALFRTVGHEGFAQSMSHASTAFMEIDELAATAYGETSDLFSIMRSGYADLQRMNVSWAEQKNLIRDVANTAGIVGEDLSFVGRDLQEMLAGRAHMGTNQLFTRVMAPMGFDTTSFNALPDAQRLQAIQRVMASMGGGEGAAAVGNTLGAQLSTMTSKFNMLRESFFKPFFSPNGLITRTMRRVLEALSSERMQGLMTSLERMGNSLAERIAPVFQFVGDTLVYAINHFEDVAARVKRMFQQVAHTAATLAALRVGTAGAGAAASLTGTNFGSVISGLVSTFMASGPLAALGSLTSALLPLAAVFVLLAGLATAAYVNWQYFADLFTQMQPVGNEFIVTLQALWVQMQSLLQIVGELAGPAVLVAAIAALTAFVTGMRQLQMIMVAIQPQIELVKNAVHAFFVSFLENLTWAARQLGFTFEALKTPGGHAGLADSLGPNLVDAIAPNIMNRRPGYGSTTPTGAPDARTPPANNDFRGSHIRINQEFKEADPDRVMHQIVNDINRQAERRISSGQTSPLTR